jgi:hypothetical protein
MQDLTYPSQGGAICASFVVFGALSVLVYRPWRRRVDRYRGVVTQPGEQPTTDASRGQDLGAGPSGKGMAQGEDIGSTREPARPPMI